MVNQSLLANAANRDFLLYRIICGRLEHPSGCYILSPSLDVLYQAAGVYKKYYELSLEQGIFDDNTIRDYLTAQGRWKAQDENNLNNILPKHIEYWKEELYKSYWNTSRQETIRKGLQSARDEYNRLNTIRHCFDHVTAGGVANYARLQYIIERTTFK